MRILFVGESDTGINPSSQSAQSLRAIGHETAFDSGSGWRSREWRERLRWADCVHVVVYAQCDWMLLRKLWTAISAGLPIVRYWVGSDCLWARHHQRSRRFAVALQELGAVQLAVATHLIDELRESGVSAEYTPVLAPNVSERSQPMPLPGQFTVLAYLPTRRRTLYGGPVMDRLMADMPDVRFIILGDSETDYRRFRNVESLGHVDDPARTMGRCTVLVRPTLHDGMPRMVLEALSHGRHVVSTFDYPHCHQAAGPSEMKTVLRRLRSRTDFNLSGREFVCEHFETARTANALADRMARLIASGQENSRLRSKRQAMAFFVKHPWILSRSHAPLPTAEELPEDAVALRAVLTDASAGKEVVVA